MITVNEIRKEKLERVSIDDVLKNEIEFGTLVTIKRNTFRGVLKVLGMIYDYNKDKTTLWVETKEDIYKVDPSEIEIVKEKPTQAKKGFNGYKTKLTETAVKDIYLMATTTNMNHKLIVAWVKLHHDIEIVPKTVSDIKLGKRWGKLTSTLGKGAKI